MCECKNVVDVEKEKDQIEAFSFGFYVFICEPNSDEQTFTI